MLHTLSENLIDFGTIGQSKVAETVALIVVWRNAEMGSQDIKFLKKPFFRSMKRIPILVYSAAILGKKIKTYEPQSSYAGTEK